MKKSLFIFANAAAIFLTPCIAICHAQPETLQAKIDTLSEEINRHEIKRLEVIWVNPNAESRNTITPKILDKRFDRKLIINELRGDNLEKSLSTAVKLTSISHFAKLAEGDVRWGIKFFKEKNDIPTLSLYFDGTGESGVVDDTPVSFQGGLYKWLDKNFSKFFNTLAQ